MSEFQQPSWNIYWDPSACDNTTGPVYDVQAICGLCKNFVNEITTVYGR